MINISTQNGSVYNNNINQSEPTEKIDNYTAQMLIYRAEMYVLLRYPHLIDINMK